MHWAFRIYMLETCTQYVQSIDNYIWFNQYRLVVSSTYINMATLIVINQSFDIIFHSNTTRIVDNLEGIIKRVWPGATRLRCVRILARILIIPLSSARIFQSMFILSVGSPLICQIPTREEVSGLVFRLYRVCVLDTENLRCLKERITQTSCLSCQTSCVLKFKFTSK